MKVIAILGIVCLVGVTVADSVKFPLGCKLINGKCVKGCEEGTVSYSLKDGCGYATPEATCDNPAPVEDLRFQICDYYACYCAPPTVRDTVSKKCVKLEDCPKEAETE